VIVGIACDTLVHPSPLAMPIPKKNATATNATTFALALRGSYISNLQLAASKSNPEAGGPALRGSSSTVRTLPFGYGVVPSPPFLPDVSRAGSVRVPEEGRRAVPAGSYAPYFSSSTIS
jgi:hypothetical protein